MAAVLLLPPTVLAQTSKAFRGRLSSMPFDLATAAVMAGSGSMTATLSGTSLALSGTFEGLSSPATVARLHRAQRGIRGPAILELEVTKGTAGTLRATIALTAQQMTDLQAGRLYVQIHSEKAPDGNLWGWLLPQETKR